MRNICILVSTLFVSLFSFSQTQGIAFTAVGKGATTPFVTDYHCLGINNSALGWGTGYDKKHFTVGTSEFNYGIYSDSLNVDRIKSLFGAIKNTATGNAEDANWQEQRQYAKDYANAGVDISLNYNWFGFSFQSEKFGGVALSVTENYNWYSRFNEQTSEILFDGKFASLFDSLTVVFGNDTSRIENYDGISQDTLQATILGTISSPKLLSEITNGTRIKATWTRAYNFGYGRKLFGTDSTFALYAGIGGRYIQAISMFDMESSGSGLRLTSAMSPSFDIGYGANAQASSSFVGTNQGGFPPQAVGGGFGADVSISAKIGGKFNIVAAVNNIGSVKYKRNVYSLKDTLFGEYSLDGLGDLNITNAVNTLLEDGGILQLEGEQEFTVKNAANVRFGANWKINKFINIGADLVAPFDSDNPGSIQNAIYAFGGEIRPIKWLALNAGYYGGGIYRHNIPMGVYFILGDGRYEFGVSSRDVLSFVYDGSNSVSAAFGMLRFRF